jgi:hypothetical protein
VLLGQVLLVFVGSCRTTDNKLGGIFLPISEEQLREKQLREDDAFFAAQELERQEKKGKNTNLIHRQLAPLKVTYSKMVGHQRAVFLSQIISYVTGRVTKQDLRWAEDDE